MGFFKPVYSHYVWLIKTPVIPPHSECLCRARLVRVAVLRRMSVTCNFLFYIPHTVVSFKTIRYHACQNEQILLLSIFTLILYPA